MSTLFLIVMAGAAALAAVWLILPIVLARSFSTTRTLVVPDKDPSQERSQLIGQILASMDDGVRLGLGSNRTNWIRQLASREHKWRPQVVEGVGLGFGILTSTGHRRWKGLNLEAGSASKVMSSLLCRGSGVWAAKRYGRETDPFLEAIKPLASQERCECIDGYGFKFGLFEFVEDRRNISHLHAISLPYRRAAFHGLGRALYFLFMNNRRGLFEAVSDLAPDHDADVMEGVGHSAAFVHCDAPRKAINFARAVPYEWRAHVHLGMTLALSERREFDPDYFTVCMAQLPPTSIAAIDEAVDMVQSTRTAICRDYPDGGYFVWRDRLLRRLQDNSVWEPAHADAMKDASLARTAGIKKKESK
jgi:hypothetical protein